MDDRSELPRMLGLVALAVVFALVLAEAYVAWLFYQEFLSPGSPEAFFALLRSRAWLSLGFQGAIIVAMGALAWGLYLGRVTPTGSPRKLRAAMVMLIGGLLPIPSMVFNLASLYFTPDPEFYYVVLWATLVAASFAIPVFLLGLWTFVFGGRGAMAVPAQSRATPSVDLGKTDSPR